MTKKTNKALENAKYYKLKFFTHVEVFYWNWSFLLTLKSFTEIEVFTHVEVFYWNWSFYSRWSFLLKLKFLLTLKSFTEIEVFHSSFLLTISLTLFGGMWKNRSLLELLQIFTDKLLINDSDKFIEKHSIQ